MKYIRIFYKTYPDFEEISTELSWTHYNELIIIKDDAKRKFYEKLGYEIIDERALQLKI